MPTSEPIRHVLRPREIAPQPDPCEDEIPQFQLSALNDVPECQVHNGALATAVDADERLVTSRGYLFYSQIKDRIGGASNLPCFVRGLNDSEFAYTTLVIDEAVTLTQPLILPPRVSLRGVGIGGRGLLTFDGLPAGESAIRFVQTDDPADRPIYTTISDLAVYRGKGSPAVVGIDLSYGVGVYINNVRVSNFFAAMLGNRPGTISGLVHVSQCSLPDNDNGIILPTGSRGWRVRDTVISGAKCWGIRVFGASDNPFSSQGGKYAEDHVFDGCQIYRCGRGGVSFAGRAAALANTRLVDNLTGVWVRASARSTRLISNYFNGDNLIVDAPGATVSELANFF